MALNSYITEHAAKFTAWRRHIHENPELSYEELNTADFVAGKLRDFGIDVVTGLAKTGVVGVLHGKGNKGGKAIGLRADMDALPITEKNTFDYVSKTPGNMHACGHDGHTAMLLAAAEYLAKTRDFDGTVYFIFQPAEEGGAGADRMIKEGLFDKFSADSVYALHNAPGMPVGSFGISYGPAMAAHDHFEIEIKGVGCHAAMPHLGIDPVVVASHMVVALQSLVSRNTDPVKAAVVSATQVHAGNAWNVIPETACLRGTVRTFDREVKAMIRKRMTEIVENLPKAFGAEANLKYTEHYPAVYNRGECPKIAANVARTVVGADRVDSAYPPCMGAEDFAYIAEVKPAAYLWVGNGDSAPLHSPYYNFNDDALPVGASFFTALVEQSLPIESA